MNNEEGSERLDEQIREAEARFDLLKARAEAAGAIAEMETISGLLATLKRERNRFATLRKKGLADRLEASRLEIEAAHQELENAIDRASAHYTEWDHAGQKLIRARLNEAGATLRLNGRGRRR